jgi:hypothetical protein
MIQNGGGHIDATGGNGASREAEMLCEDLLGLRRQLPSSLA